MKKLIVSALVILLLLTLLPQQAQSDFSQPKNTPNRGSMNSPWPMFRHDGRHSCQSPYGKEGCTGVLKRKVDLGEGLPHSSPVIDADGTIYLGLCAVNPDGTIKWKLGRGEDFNAIGKDGTVYALTHLSNYLIAVDPDGTIKWKRKVGQAFSSGPPLVDDNNIIYVATHNIWPTRGNLTALYPNGTIKWSISLPGPCTPALHNNTIYVDCFEDGYLYAIFANNGTIKWKRKVGNPDAKLTSGPSVDKEGIIYYGSRSGYLYAFYPNGTLKWKIKMGVSMSPAISDNGTLYVVEGSHLCALDRNGSVIWKCKTYSMSDYLLARGLAIDKNGIIYGYGEHQIYAVNPNGTLRWVWKTNDYIICAPSIGKDGIIYVTGYTAGQHEFTLHIYAIEPRDAADLRIRAIYYGPTWKCIRFKLKNVGCEPAYNVSCKVKIRMMPWRGDGENRIYETTVPFIDVNQEIEVRISGIYASPLIYSPFPERTLLGTLFGGNLITLMWVEADDANGDMCWEGGSGMEITIIGPLVCVGGLWDWIRYKMGWGVEIEEYPDL